MTQTAPRCLPNGRPSVKAQTEIHPEGCPSDAFIQAVRDGDLDAAKAIYAQDLTQAVCTSEIVQLAAMSGCVAVLDWTHSLTSDDCSKAFQHYTFPKVCFKPGHLEVFQWLHEHSYRFCTPAMFRGTAESGDMDTLHWMIEHYPESFELSKCIHMDNAAGFDNLHMIKWLHEHDFCFSSTAIDSAAQHGLLHIVRWLHENRVDGCSTWAMDSAATFGHLDVLLFLHFHRTEGCTTTAMDLAAENGHFEVVQFLHFNRTEGCTTAAMDNAASVEILAFLHEHRTEGCTDEIVAKVVGKSSVPILQWLVENKPELVNLEDIRELAVQAGKDAVVAWVDVVRADSAEEQAGTDVNEADSMCESTEVDTSAPPISCEEVA